MLRIASALALLAVVAAGCGGADRAQQTTVDRLPRALARQWADQASAIALAASEGDDCRALTLATSLRADVAAKQHELPARLRTPLLSGVTALAGRITCTPTATGPTTPHKPPPHKPHRHKPPHPPHGHHGHGEHHGHGGGKGHDK